MLGRPNCGEPVLMKHFAGPWLNTSVFIPRSQQTSSAMVRWCGSNSPIGMPHLARAAAREFAKLQRPVSAAEFGPYHALVRP